MHSLAKFIIVSGLGLDIIGAALLAFDLLILSPAKVWRLKNYKTRLSIIQIHRDGIIETYKKMISSHPDMRTQKYAQKYIDKANDDYEKEKAGIEDEIKELRDEEPPELLFKSAKWGFGFLITGFILQAIGTLL